MPIVPLFSYGGSGAVLSLSIANGFPPETYIPLLEPLTSDYRVVSLPPRALWQDPPQPKTFTTWYTLGSDLADGLVQHDLSDAVLIGHSMGGVASVMAALSQPDRVRALILLDPTFMPAWILTMFAVFRTTGRVDRLPLVRGALRRRTDFSGHDEAFEYWRPKRLFHDWDDRTLRHYVEGMLAPSANGTAYTLRWPPAWEAQVYRTIPADIWRLPRRLPAQLPVLILHGTETDTYRASSVARMKRILPRAVHVPIEGHGHLFPQSAPDEARQVITEWLKAIPG